MERSRRVLCLEILNVFYVNKKMRSCDRIFPGLGSLGLKYAHLPYGPVPDHFDMIPGKMAAENKAAFDALYQHKSEIEYGL